MFTCTLHLFHFVMLDAYVVTLGVAGLGLGLLLILGGPCGSSETLVPVQVQVKVQVQVRAQVKVQVQLPGVMCVYLHSVSQSFPHGHACVCSSHTSE